MKKVEVKKVNVKVWDSNVKRFRDENGEFTNSGLTKYDKIYGKDMGLFDEIDKEIAKGKEIRKELDDLFETKFDIERKNQELYNKLDWLNYKALGMVYGSTVENEAEFEKLRNEINDTLALIASNNAKLGL